MNRLLLLVGFAVAGALVAAPAVAGLRGNTSFSRDIQVPVPSGAHPVRLSEVAQPSSPPTPRHTGGSDDRRERPDDHPRHSGATSSGVDDHGGLRTRSTPGGGGSTGVDDHGGGDDRGSGRSRGGHGGRG